MHPAPAVLRPLARRIADHRQADLTARDQVLIDRLEPVTRRRLQVWFPTEVRGIENVPAAGSILVVANHSCLFWMPDAWIIADEVAQRRGLDRPTFGLAYDLLFAIPIVGPVLRRIGGLPAGIDAAAEVLRAGAAVIVFPGGDHDACRPWTDRDRIAFGDHRGFVRLALRTGVPVAPVVAHGPHHGVMVLARGEPLARWLGLAGVRVNVLPFVLGPLGPAPIVTVPLPAKLTVSVLPPLDWSRHGPAAADDEEVVEACYREITARMQEEMDRLAAEHPHPVMEGTTQLIRRVAGSALHVLA